MKTNTAKQILEFVRKNGQVTPKQVIEYTGFGAPAIFRQLKKLKEGGLIAKTGKPPKVWYHLPIDNEAKKPNDVEDIISLIIKLSSFGHILTSRPSAKKAWIKTKSVLAKKNIDKEKILIDFDGLDVLSAGWADEFISSLKSAYSNRVVLLPSKNKSVQMSLEFVSGT